MSKLANRQINKSTNQQTGKSADQQNGQSANSRTGLRLTSSGAEAAFRAEKNTPLVRAFLAAIRDKGGRPRFVLKTGTSDMNVVGPIWGCPICSYGPGDSALDHTPDERISLSEYLQSVGILKAVLHILMDDTQNRSSP
jgi:acetylornithine deacetylase/succinyl-diaminopimelate desuccinylase-like protein